MIALFFDTETNGIKTWDNPDFRLRVVQLGAILQDLETGRVLAEVNLIANQGGYKIPPQASNVHGITDDLAARVGVPLGLIDEAFYALLEKADIIVAHNIQYDVDVVNDDLPASTALINSKPQFCTMQGSLYIVRAPLSDRQKAYFTSKGKMPDAPYKVPNLTETHMHFYGRPFEGAHDAMADIRACRDIFVTLIEQGFYALEGGEVSPTKKLQDMTAKG